MPSSFWPNPIRRWCLLFSGAATVLVANGQGLSVTLTPTDHNGYNISCFGAQDGAIDATVSGGTTPYTFSWSNSATTEDVSDLAAGFYELTVIDADSLSATAQITLTEPEALEVTMTPYAYPNRYNVSCHECYNGIIDVEVAKGVPPYSYAWGDDANVTTQDRSALGAMTYDIIVTDGNGCTQQQRVTLLQPESSDWTRGGNAGTDPNTQFIGTADAKDMVFKSNGQELLRLKSNGDISLAGSLGTGILYRNADGTLRGGGFPTLDPLPDPHCHLLDAYPFWETRGNSFNQLCQQEVPLLGTLNDLPLRIVTDAQQRMIVTTEGKVGIGTEPPGGPIQGYRLFVEDGIATRDVLVKLGTWPDYVFDSGYRLMPLSELRAFLRANKHLPTMPAAAALEEQGGAELGDIQRRLLRTVEEQALYILELEERLERVERLLQTLETSR